MSSKPSASGKRLLEGLLELLALVGRDLVRGHRVDEGEADAGRGREGGEDEAELERIASSFRGLLGHGLAGFLGAT